jgi:cytochrome P450
MNETLRLWGPIANHPKWTDRTPQLLTIGGKEHFIPAEVYVNINQTAVHTLPKYWGDDSLQWLPDRWISLLPTTPDSTIFDSEILRDPPGGKGTFIPFADGARGCVGKKFSQVEFVAVLATLFREYRVRPKVLEGESMEEARKRIMEYVNDVEPNITLQLKKSRAAGFGLVWEKR